MIKFLKSWMPWWIKVVAKLILSNVPNKYVFFRRFNIFKHGEMLVPSYAISVFLYHYDRNKDHIKNNYTILELGPGDSLATAIISYAFGASKIYLVDIENCASKRINFYHQLINELLTRNDLKNDIKYLLKFNDINDILKSINAQYFTNGISSLEYIDDGSVDFVFSNAVLQHVHKNLIPILFNELKRVSSKECIMSHVINYNDHISYSLNSLRFSEKIWESRMFKNSGFYTNRIRHDDMVEILHQTGFITIENDIRKWDKIPINPKYLHQNFRKRKDLQIFGVNIICFRK